MLINLIFKICIVLVRELVFQFPSGSDLYFTDIVCTKNLKANNDSVQENIMVIAASFRGLYHRPIINHKQYMEWTCTNVINNFKPLFEICWWGQILLPVWNSGTIDIYIFTVVNSQLSDNTKERGSNLQSMAIYGKWAH